MSLAVLQQIGVFRKLNGLEGRRVMFMFMTSSFLQGAMRVGGGNWGLFGLC